MNDFGWLAQSFKFAYMFSAQQEPAQIFQLLTGQEPEIVSHNQKASIINEVGLYNNFILKTFSRKDRLEIWADPKDEAALLEEDVVKLVNSDEFLFSNIGLYESSIGEFKSIVLNVFNGQELPRLARLAFSTKLIRQFVSQFEVYSNFKEFLPITLDPNVHSDFMLKLNIKEHLADHLFFNCLSHTYASIAVNEYQRADGQITFRSPEAHCANLDLDINTPVLKNEDEIQTFQNQDKVSLVNKIFQLCDSRVSDPFRKGGAM